MLRRMWESPRFIPLLGVLTVLALGAAAFAVFAVLPLDEQRERDRITSDLAACDRVNQLRLEVVALGDADQDMIAGIIDVVLPAGDRPQVDELRTQLEPVLARHQARIDDIEFTECTEVVPGAPTTEGP